MSIDGRQIANFVLDKCDELGRPVTNLALQKIVYFCHVWYLVKKGQPLIRHNFEAWRFGPVLQYLYREFKLYEATPITERAKRLNKATGKLEVAEYAFESETLKILTNVVTFYSKISPGTLVALSHAEDGPWHKSWTKGQSTNPGMLISNQEIVDFYSSVRSPI